MLLILDLSCLIAYGNPLSLFEFRLQKICYLSPLPLWGTEIEDKTNLFAFTKFIQVTGDESNIRRRCRTP